MKRNHFRILPILYIFLILSSCSTKNLSPVNDTVFLNNLYEAAFQIVQGFINGFLYYGFPLYILIYLLPAPFFYFFRFIQAWNPLGKDRTLKKQFFKNYVKLFPEDEIGIKYSLPFLIIIIFLKTFLWDMLLMGNTYSEIIDMFKKIYLEPLGFRVSPFYFYSACLPVVGFALGGWSVHFGLREKYRSFKMFQESDIEKIMETELIDQKDKQLFISTMTDLNKLESVKIKKEWGKILIEAIENRRRNLGREIYQHKYSSDAGFSEKVRATGQIREIGSAISKLEQALSDEDNPLTKTILAVIIQVFKELNEQFKKQQAKTEEERTEVTKALNFLKKDYKEITRDSFFKYLNETETTLHDMGGQDDTIESIRQIVDAALNL